MSEGVCDMSTGVMFYEGASAGRRRAPRGLPGAAVRVGRLLELWGYRAARPTASRSDRVDGTMRLPAADATRIGGASLLEVTRPRIY